MYWNVNLFWVDFFLPFAIFNFYNEIIFFYNQKTIKNKLKIYLCIYFSGAVPIKYPISIFRQFTELAGFFLNLGKQLIFLNPHILSKLISHWTITRNLFWIVISKWSENQNEVTIICCHSYISQVAVISFFL